MRLAKDFEREGKFRLAATAYDRAFGLNPADEEIKSAGKNLLDRLAVTEHGIKFRYIPAGSFLMGSVNGDPDEQPQHQVRLDEFWLAETPISWAAYCDLMDWEPPPISRPGGHGDHYQGFGKGPMRQVMFHLLEANKIRMQYCEDATVHAGDWHSHAPEHNWIGGGTNEVVSSRTLFGTPPEKTHVVPGNMIASLWSAIHRRTRKRCANGYQV